MLASMRQIRYIQTHNKYQKQIPLMVFTMFKNLLFTKKITLTSYTECLHDSISNDYFNFSLSFACTKQGFEILNKSINTVLEAATCDNKIMFHHKHCVYEFSVPIGYANSGVKELEKCKCITVRFYIKNLASKTRLLSLLAKETKKFI